jgi:hypothetical protein
MITAKALIKGMRKILSARKVITMSAHTPGPWAILEYRGAVDEVIPSGRPGVICSFPDPGKRTRANAQLISAAPDLYDAIKKLLAQEENAEGEARAAIEKAEGRAS